MERPTPPELPRTDIRLRVPTYEPFNITQHLEGLPGAMLNFKCKEVKVYTREQLDAYGQAMHLHGIAESRYIAEVYATSPFIRFAKDVARALHDHFHCIRTNYFNNQG